MRALIHSREYPATLAKVTDVGITPEGAVWVIARNWFNRTPDGTGRLFIGFRQMEDDLGRDYRRVYAVHDLLTNQSADVFVPMDYPFDTRTPRKIILTCKSEHHPHIKRNIVGTIELTTWKQGHSWPEGAINSDRHRRAMTLAQRHCTAQRYDQAERILTTIPTQPEDSPTALAREQLLTRIKTQKRETR